MSGRFPLHPVAGTVDAFVAEPGAQYSGRSGHLLFGEREVGGAEMPIVGDWIGGQLERRTDERRRVHVGAVVVERRRE